MNGPAVELTHVTKRYGSQAALSDVSFTLREGEAVGYLGPNGAGKTTTLRLLAGLTRPVEGTVRVFGRAPEQAGEALRDVGALVGTPALLPYVSPRDFLRYVADARGIRGPDLRRSIESAAAQMGVGPTLDRPCGGLSTGQSRRVLLASALLGAPRLLLLDEPTLGLDPAARLDVRRHLLDLRHQGHSILLSTHLLEDVSAICDRVLFLREGRLLADEPVRRPGPTGTNTTVRSLRLRFLVPTDLAQLRPLLRGTESVGTGGPRELYCALEDSDERQAELVAAIARAGLGLLCVEPVADDLDRRYLDVVGREEAT